MNVTNRNFVSRMESWIMATSAILFLSSLPFHANAAAQPNSAEASLSVNYNTAGIAPLQATFGEIDSNVLVLDGPPNAKYRVKIGRYQDGVLEPGLGYNHIRSDKRSRKYRGTLDQNGHAVIVIDPNRFKAGMKNLAAQAEIRTQTKPPVSTYSAATQIDVITTMSSPVLLRPTAGSVATVLGPITDIDLVAGTVSVADVVFSTNASTVMENFTGLDALEIGGWLSVEGQYDGSSPEGKVAMTMVTEDASSEARLRGRIQGLGPAGFSILDGSVYLTNATTYVDDTTGLPESYATLTDGMVVEIRLPANTSFPHISEIRTNVEIEFEPEPEPEPEPESSPPRPICS